MTLDEPPESHTPPILGWRPIASAIFCPYIISNLEVGHFT